MVLSCLLYQPEKPMAICLNEMLKAAQAQEQEPLPLPCIYEILEYTSDDVQEILNNQERDARNKALGL